MCVCLCSIIFDDVEFGFLVHGFGIQASVVDGFGEVFDFYVLAVVEVCDRSGYFEYSVVCSGGEALFFHGYLEYPLSVFADLADFPDLLGAHLGVVVDVWAVFEAVVLKAAGGGYALSDLFAGFCALF